MIVCIYIYILCIYIYNIYILCIYIYIIFIFIIYIYVYIYICIYTYICENLKVNLAGEFAAPPNWMPAIEAKQLHRVPKAHQGTNEHELSTAHGPGDN